MTDQATRFTPAEKILSMLLIAGLAYFGFYLVMMQDSERETVTEEGDSAIFEAETPDSRDVTTIRESRTSPLPGCLR